MHVERDLEKKIKAYLSAPEIISVVGVIQESMVRWRYLFSGLNLE